MSIMEIRDLEIPELEVYIDKKEVQLLHYYEPEPGIFIAESPNVILRALEAGYEPLSLLMEKKPLDEKGESNSGPVRRNPGLYGFFGGPYENHRISACAGNAVCDAAQSPSFLKRKLCRKAPDAILEDVVNPTNVGAIFRSAAALSMDAVLLTKGSSDPLYRRAVRVSMGTVFQIPWTIMDAGDWPERAMQELRSMGYRTAARRLRRTAYLLRMRG